MGLCMGFSFVSLAEIVYYGIWAMVNAVKCRKTEPETKIEDWGSY